MNVSQTTEHLVLRDWPSNLWFAGASFIFMATIFLAKGVGYLLLYERVPLWLCGGELAIGSAGLIAGLLAFSHNPMVAAEFHPHRNLVAVRKQGLLSSTPREVPLQFVNGIEVTEIKGLQGDPSYCLQLSTVSGEKIPLGAAWTPGKAAHDEAATQIRDFLGQYGLSV